MFFIRLSVSLEISESLLIHVNLFHFSLILLTFFFLFLDKFCSLKKTVLDPVLQRVESEWNDHHNEDKFDVWMSIKNRKSRHTKANHVVSICVFNRKNGQFRKCNDHEPYEKLYVVHLVVNMFVQLFPSIPIDVLGIMNRKINTTLKD